jgi:hypothetical protein
MLGLFLPKDQKPVVPSLSWHKTRTSTLTSSGRVLVLLVLRSAMGLSGDDLTHRGGAASPKVSGVV